MSIKNVNELLEDTGYKVENKQLVGLNGKGEIEYSSEEILTKIPGVEVKQPELKVYTIKTEYIDYDIPHSVIVVAESITEAIALAKSELYYFERGISVECKPIEKGVITTLETNG